MYKLDTTYLNRCTLTLEKALKELNKSDPDDISYDLYRSACIKEFEIILEQAGNLLKKCLKPYFANPKQLDRLVFKDIFRYSGKHGIIELDELERWLGYRDNRNTTTHDYGSGFAEETLIILEQFIVDSYSLVKALNNQNEIKE